MKQHMLIIYSRYCITSKAIGQANNMHCDANVDILEILLFLLLRIAKCDIVNCFYNSFVQQRITYRLNESKKAMGLKI